MALFGGVRVAWEKKKLTTPQRSTAPDLSAARWQIVKPRTARREILLSLV